MKKIKFHTSYFFLAAMLCSCFGDSSTPVVTSPSVKDFENEQIVSKTNPAQNDSSTTLSTIHDSLSRKRITGIVKYTSSYCGGAHPPPEILEQHSTPRPLSDSKIRLVSVNTKKEYIVATDKNGKFTVDLPEDKYNFYITKNINRNLQTGFTPTCEIEINKLRSTFDLKKSSVYLQADFECDPCDPSMRMRP